MASDISECKHTNRETDSSLGMVHCPDCGQIFEEGTLVSEVQFQESGGRTVAQGQLMRLDRNEGGHWPWMPHTKDMLNYDSVTIHKVSKMLRPKAADLKFTEEQTTAAIDVYKMALRLNLTRGRKFDHCLAACLYIVCRIFKINLMLLDLSDYFRINVYTLGKTYLQISNGLHIATPVIEPTIYISRFAARLEFGSHRPEVERTANRIVQRMNRDWMTTGRRPSGLCGAALLVAARMHNFCRSVKEMVKVVKICEATIRKRLMEFHDVPSSELSIEHFGTVSPSKEEDPPCFTEGKRKSSMAEQISQEKLRTLTVELSGLQEEIEKSLESSATKPRGIWAKFAKMGDMAASPSTSSGDSGRDEIMEFLETEVFQEVLQDELVSPTPQSSKDEDAATASTSTSTSTSSSTSNFETLSALQSKMGLSPTNLILGARHASTSLGLGSIVPQCLSKTEGEDENESKDADDGELDLTGIDDKEIDSLLLTEEEARTKTEMWMKQNGAALRELEEKELQKAKELAENGPKPVKKRKANKRKAMPEAASAQHAVYRVLQDNKLSSKINYDVLKDLQPSPSPVPASSTDTSLPLDPSSPRGSSNKTSRSAEDSTTKEPPKKQARRSASIKPKPTMVKANWTSMSAQLSSNALSSLSTRSSPASLSGLSRTPASLGRATPTEDTDGSAQQTTSSPGEEGSSQAGTSQAVETAPAERGAPVLEDASTEKNTHAEKEENNVEEEEQHTEDEEDLEDEDEDDIPPFLRSHDPIHDYDEGDEYYD